MRTRPFLAALLAVLSCRTATMDPPPPPAPPPDAATPAPSPAASTSEVSFEASVKPLLARTCTPCHVPGGRMYERMPFDRPEVVLSHKDRILGRLKNPDDRQVLERWLAGQTKG